MKINKGSNTRLHRAQLEAVGVILPAEEQPEPVRAKKGRAPAVRQSRQTRSPRRAPAAEGGASPEVTVRTGTQANVLTSTGGPEVTVTSGKGKK